MPKICRSMVEDVGKPMVGPEGRMLGVRVAPNPQPDIPVDPNGNVQPNSGGMSVAPEWPYFLVPRRLRAIRSDARGRNDLVCWSMSEGPFERGDISDGLLLRPDPDNPSKHGFVEPAREMSIDEFQECLAQTRDQWVRDEG
jgi:hypothetical protein